MAGIADIFGNFQSPLMQMLMGFGRQQSPFSGGFMPGVEGEGLSPDPYAKTFPESYGVDYSKTAIPGTLDTGGNYNIPGTRDVMTFDPEMLATIQALFGRKI